MCERKKKCDHTAWAADDDGSPMDLVTAQQAGGSSSIDEQSSMQRVEERAPVPDSLVVCCAQKKAASWQNLFAASQHVPAQYRHPDIPPRVCGVRYS